MFHRVMSLLLVPTLHLQGMDFCHSHGGTCVHEPARCEQRPHFHLCMVGLYHHAHKDHHADQVGKPKGHKDHAVGQPAPTPDHDDDAIYVPSLVLLGSRSWYPHVASGEHSAPIPMDGMVGRPLGTALLPSLALRQPSLPCRHSPIYLRTLPLLI
jgi:hypothetical protein